MRPNNTAFISARAIPIVWKATITGRTIAMRVTDEAADQIVVLTTPEVLARETAAPMDRMVV